MIKRRYWVSLLLVTAVIVGCYQKPDPVTAQNPAPPSGNGETGQAAAESPKPAPAPAPLIEAMDPMLVDYYKDAFPDVAYQSSHPIADTITEGNANSTYLRVYDAAQNFLGYVREISTTTGCKSLCNPLLFTLTFVADRAFKKVLAPVPLTKLGHAEFEDADYKKLNELVANPPESFKNVSKPMDLVDGVTHATKPEHQNSVVHEAAFTSFRVYQYERQTVQEIEAAEVVIGNEPFDLTGDPLKEESALLTARDSGPALHKRRLGLQREGDRAPVFRDLVSPLPG
jgi:hypothetical protein